MNQHCKNKVCYYYDPPFISQMDKQKLKRVSCTYCSDMIYCSEICRDEDWAKTHQQKCPDNPENQQVEESSSNYSERVSEVESQQQQFQMPIQLHHLVDIQDRFLEDFQILDQVIGQGTYGKVVLVQDRIDKQYYAMKIISKGALQDLSQQQLDREITIQKRLQHKNVLKLHYSFQDRDYVHLVLEHASKGPITRLLKKGLSEASIWMYFNQICQGLNYLHSSMVIHRDLKPENILVTTEDEIKLCDFGWSAELDSTQKRDTICGTLDYMAPEIINQSYGPEVDLWLPVDLAKSNISRDAKDLIQGLLKTDPTQRLKIMQVFMHPWFIRMAELNNFNLKELWLQVEKQWTDNVQVRQSYFEMEKELEKEYEPTPRQSDISMSCLDNYLKTTEIDIHLFNQLSANLKEIDANIEKSEEFGYRATQVWQPRLSRISVRNNIQSQPPKQKSLLEKLTDMMSCVNRNK